MKQSRWQPFATAEERQTYYIITGGIRTGCGAGEVQTTKGGLFEKTKPRGLDEYYATSAESRDIRKSSETISRAL